MGGKGIACRCGFSKDDEVKKLFERIQKERGRLDILVNNAWSGVNHVMNGYFGEHYVLEIADSVI